MELNTILDGFIKVADTQPQLVGLELDGQSLSYGQMDHLAGGISKTILDLEKAPHPTVALLAYRSIGAYLGVLGILGAGRGYVPLNPNFPVTRTRAMLELSGCRTIVFSDECSNVLRALLETFPYELTVVCTGDTKLHEWSQTFPQHHFVAASNSDSTIPRQVVREIPPESTAYLLFTSGSTGIPKGVAVSHRNVSSYISHVVNQYGFTAHDRFSQTFEMTFDLSVHDMFVCWSSGACLVPMPHASVMAPARFIRDRSLTVWFSVPSVVMFMLRLRTLRADLLPSLRISLFCGEALLSQWAEKWQSAAPNSIVENLYGPTEATIAICRYRWKPNAIDNQCANGVVPIGRVFETQRAMVMVNDTTPAGSGEVGELWLSGSQVTAGYLNNPTKTAEQFVNYGRDETVWYRTGDLVRTDDTGDFQYLGRIDHQIQLCGHRVEMQEVEHAIRKACGNDSAVALAWPVEAGRAETIYAFVPGNPESDPSPILAECKRQLPSYMAPKRIFFVDKMPLNSNGKIDRSVLIGMLEDLQ